MTTILLADFLGSLTFNGVIEIFGTIIGLLYLYLQYKASPWFFTVAIINAIPFVYLYLDKGNYASAILFAYYGYVGIHAIVTGTTGAGEGSFKVSHLPQNLYLRLAGIFVVLWAAFYLFLINIVDLVGALNAATGLHLPVETPLAPLADAFVTALSFVGMWILSKKYIQHWLVWIVVNGVFVYLQIQTELYQWAALFTIYAIVAVMGYFEWKKLMAAQAKA